MSLTESVAPPSRAQKLRGVIRRGVYSVTPPAMLARRKHQAELAYWRGELANLDRWFNGKSMDWWGLEPPADEQKVSSSELWSTNAILTMHRLRPTYLEELQLAADAFTGMRVLEIGCGPLAPVLQFTGCERHAIDPLVDLYTSTGWPLFDLDVAFVNAFGEALPYPDAYFDAVISVNALDHCDDFGKVAAEIQRVTRPGGRICFNVEYHAPTVTEPLQLSDANVRAAFRGTQMEKLRELGKAEIFDAIVRRFNLSTTGILRRFGEISNEERFALWHGRR